MNDQGNSTSDVQRAEASATKRAAERAHGAIDSAAERLKEQEIRLRETAASAEEQIRESKDQLRGSMQSSSQELRRYVLENPLRSVAIAFAAGYLVSVLRR